MITEQEWTSFIRSLKTEESLKKEEAKKILAKAMIESIKKRIHKRMPEKGRIGVLFSGGVDSTTIAFMLKMLKADFTCYSVGLKGAEDLLWADRAAKELGFKLKKKILSEKDIEKILNRISGFLHGFDMVKAGVGCVTYAAAEMAGKDSITTIFTGLGSEEIFAGYQRHLEAEDINKECWKGLQTMYARDLMRDLPIGEKLGVNFETPFLDREVISIAMKVSGEHKLSSTQNKIMLRETAESMGLPKDFAQRKKRAAQYGSRIDKAIEKIAKSKGFRRKSDYIKSLADKCHEGMKKKKEEGRV